MSNLINATMLAKELGVSKSRLTQILQEMSDSGVSVGDRIGQVRIFSPVDVATVKRFPRRHYRKKSG